MNPSPLFLELRLHPDFMPRRRRQAARSRALARWSTLAKEALCIAAVIVALAGLCASAL